MTFPSCYSCLRRILLFITCSILLPRATPGLTCHDRSLRSSWTCAPWEQAAMAPICGDGRRWAQGKDEESWPRVPPWFLSGWPPKASQAHRWIMGALPMNEFKVKWDLGSEAWLGDKGHWEHGLEGCIFIPQGQEQFLLYPCTSALLPHSGASGLQTKTVTNFSLFKVWCWVLHFWDKKVIKIGSSDFKVSSALHALDWDFLQ